MKIEFPESLKLNAMLSTIVGMLMGIVGILMAINSYVFDLQEKKYELDNVISKAENSADYGKRFQDLTLKIETLEEYLKNVENVNVYYIEEPSLSNEVLSQRELIIKMRGNLIPKSELMNYIVNSDNVFIQEVALKSFLKQFDDADFDILIKLTLFDDSRGMVLWANLANYLPDYVNEKNYKEFFKALIKHSKGKDHRIATILGSVNVEFDDDFHQELLRLRIVFNRSQFPDTNDVLDTLLLK